MLVFKRILKWIGIFLAVLFLVILLGILFAWLKSGEYDETAIPYINEVVPILSEWDPDKARPYFLPAALESASEEDFQKLFSFLSKMGLLIELGEPQFSNVTSGVTIKDGAATIVTYTVPAEYEYGDAQLTLRLVEDGESFSIYYFNLNSSALMD